MSVLTEVEDWEGVAGILEINTFAIVQGCRDSLVVLKCRWRKVVQEYYDRQTSDNPCQVACDIARVLERFTPPKVKQANRLKDIHFGEFESSEGKGIG